MTPSALATRDLTEFDVFNDHVAGFQKLGTLQILNDVKLDGKAKKRGWFLKNEDLKSADWTASLTDFDKGSTIFDYQHKFGGVASEFEGGVLFTKVNLQILWTSPLAIEAAEQIGNTKPGTTIGRWGNPEAMELWNADKAAADLADSKREDYKRKYRIRTKYLVFILNKDKKRAHTNPIVLTVKSLNGVDLSEKLKLFRKEMDCCWSKFKNFTAPMAMNDKFHACTIFQPTLNDAILGSRGNEICGVESFEIPDYSTEEAAAASIDRFLINTDEFQDSWAQREAYANFYEEHSKQTADRLGGAHGIIEGVSMLPASDDAATTTVDVVSTPTRDELGADTTF